MDDDEFGTIERPNDGHGTSEQGWNKRSHFLMAAIGASVGMGNLWRFPLLAKKYGGGSFILVYTILVVVEGIPLTCMEVSIGRHLKSNILRTWQDVHPLASGMGFASCFVGIIVSIYYAVTLVWCIHYFFYSFQSPLPWVFCPRTDASASQLHVNYSMEQLECESSSPEEFYWYRKSLEISDGISSSFEFNIYLMSLLLLLWIMVFLSVRKGIQSATQVLYFTVLFPYLGLLVLFIRTIVLPEATHGLRYFFTPEWSTLANPQLWADAGAHVIFSIGIGIGVFPAFAGLNRKEGSSLVDAIVIVTADTLTGLLGVLVVFSILSFRAGEKLSECLSASSTQTLHQTRQGSSPRNTSTQGACSMATFLDETQGGTGLAFINFTYAFSYIPGASLFSALFFLMLFSLGFDSLVAFIIPPVQAVSQLVPVKFKGQAYLTALGCLLCWCLGAILTQPSGEYMFQLFSGHSQDLALLLLVLIECLAFGISTSVRAAFRSNVKPRWLAVIIEFLCIVVNPLLLISMIVSNCIRYGVTGDTYSLWDKMEGTLRPVAYPEWAKIVGYAFTMTPMLIIACGFAYGVKDVIRHRKGAFTPDALVHPKLSTTSHVNFAAEVLQMESASIS